MKSPSTDPKKMFASANKCIATPNLNEMLVNDFSSVLETENHQIIACPQPMVCNPQLLEELII